jgi:hypothetical protein
MIGDGFNDGKAMGGIKQLEMLAQLFGSEFLELQGLRADRNRNLRAVSFLPSQSRQDHEG